MKQWGVFFAVWAVLIYAVGAYVAWDWSWWRYLAELSRLNRAFFGLMGVIITVVPAAFIALIVTEQEGKI